MEDIPRRDGRNGRVRAARRRAITKKTAQQPFLDRIARIPSMVLSDLPSLIELAALEENVHTQMLVVQKCLELILSVMNPQKQLSPRLEQVRTLRRLIFGKGDTLLIACTGFGKSLILHAFSILTGKITLQIVPLSKLGDEQLLDIQRIGYTRPCLITSESKRKERDLVNRFQAGEFTHVLLGPEQAASKVFRTALKDPSLQQRIGLVAIDECHLVKQWKDFRADFTMIGELRSILRRDIVWFGCSATLDSEAEQTVLQSAGFRSIGINPYQTQVIRTSIDRPDISICAQPIPRGKLGQYDQLYFLLDDAIHASTQELTPERIPKTIVFIDGRTKVEQAAMYLRRILLSKSASFDQQYTPANYSEKACVYKIVDTFTSHVAQYDRDLRYSEFRKTSSITRIMVATTALGLGVNIPDIARVVIWKFPIGNDPSEVWQRIGRGGRGSGIRSLAYIFLPYWAFSTEGQTRIGMQLETPKEIPQIKRYKRNMLPKYQARILSQLQSSFTPGDISDTESVASSISAYSQQTDEDQDQDQDQDQCINGRIRYWTRRELEQRSALSECWKKICGTSCRRAPFLEYLGESKLREPLLPVAATDCCDSCNPALFEAQSQAPEAEKLLETPRSGTRPALALQLLEQWTTLQAELCYSAPSRRYPMPSGAFMSAKCHWQLAWLYQQVQDSFWDTLSISQLIDRAPLLAGWPHLERYKAILIVELQQIYAKVGIMHARIALDRRSKKRQQSQKRPDSSRLSRADVSDYTQIDNTLASKVARQQRLEALQQQEALQLRERLQQQSSIDTSHISSSLIVDKGIQRMLSVLQQARKRAQDADSLIHSARAHLIDIQETQPDERIPETQCDERVIETQLPLVQPRLSITPSKRRVPLGDKDINARKAISFSPLSRSGRTRQMTDKGKENFFIR